MSKVKDIVQDMIQSFIEAEGYELVDIEYVKEGENKYLRIYVDKDGGIDIDDCGRISEYISQKLDETDPISEAYILEVSSPGAERPLKKVKDFENAVDKNVFITTYEPIDGLKEFEGILTTFQNEVLEIKVVKKTYQIPLNKVASARLAVLF
ncbi:ribosome maturation factor RimP [Chengkuizengella axinellae]|uniref:Ribosome maturation factor RimP n=1 Tax=Chengkuizengella axinellae TaxID=3064388 RepID=A0ABT9IXF2_9BACL|nr:ribosome maturation factor RimP [Chengkuizengella sp. 2205SS18-9]MDP5273479.1 ribosome maturation factor RimP [Chengkuizengella sp. 2205SS18-9]